MKRGPQDTWNVWRDAEDEGRLDQADRAFAVLARDWPRTVLPPGLVARVAGLGAANGLNQARIWELAWLRLAVGGVLVGTGVVLGGLPGRVLGGLLLASLQTVVTGVGSVLALVSAWAQAVSAIGTPLIRASHALGAALAQPLPVLVLMVNMLLAAAALAALRRLLGTVDAVR